MSDQSLNSWIDSGDSSEVDLSQVNSLANSTPLEDQPLEDPVPLDTNTEAADLTAVLAAMEDLDLLAADLYRTGGMSRQFAMEAQRLMPDFDGQAPLGYYTAQPSATRFTRALEEMERGMMAAIAAGVAALLYLCYRVLKWLFGDKSSDTKEIDPGKVTASVEQKAEAVKEAAKDTAEHFEEVAKAAEEVEKEVRRGVTFYDQAGKEFSFVSLEALVEKVLNDSDAADEVNEFMNSSNPFFHDIVNNGEYTRLMGAVAKVFSSNIKSQVYERLDFADLIMTRDASTSTNDLAKNKTMLDKMVSQRYIQIAIDGKTMDLRECTSYIRNEEQAVGQRKVNKKMKFEDVFYRAKDSCMKGPLAALMDNYVEIATYEAEATKRLEVIRKKLGNVATDGVAGVSKEIGPELRKVMECLQADLTSVAQIAALIRSYKNHLDRVHSAAFGFSTKFAAAVGRGLRNPEEDLKEAIEKLTKISTDARKAHRKMVVNL